MSVFEIDPLRDSRWNTFVEHHRAASVFHRAEWLRALKCAYGYEPVAVSSCSPASPLTNALVFCRIRSFLTGNRFVSLPFSDHCEPLVNSTDEAESLIANMKGKVDQKTWKYFEMRPVSAISGARRLLAINTTYIFHRLNLGRTEEELFKSFHKDCVQRKIRRADRESLRYHEGASETLLNQFYKLHVLTRRRQGLPPQPLKWFRSLIVSFGKDLKIRVALKDNIPIAGILTLSHRKTMTYKYGCSDAKFHNLGGTALLFWRTIREARAGGFEELDMGRSDTYNTGLVTFKEHWGAERSILTYWRYPAKPTGLMRGRTMRIMRRMAAVAPDRSLTMLGNLLYRHIG